MTSHGCHNVSNHRQFDCLLTNPLSVKQTLKIPLYCPFVRGNRPVSSGFPHKGSVMWKIFLDVIIHQHNEAMGLLISNCISELDTCVYIIGYWLIGPRYCVRLVWTHCYYSDFIMGVMASQITSLTIVYPTVYSGADQRKHQTPRQRPLCAYISSNAENVSIWWRHHVIKTYLTSGYHPMIWDVVTFMWRHCNHNVIKVPWV